jgi:hypothetical protein
VKKVVHCSSATHRGVAISRSWPFFQPQNCAVFTSTHITDDRLPILLAVHDSDDTWQFLSGDFVTDADAKLLCLGCAYTLDPSLAELADLPRGWLAERTAPGQPWTRAPHHEE